MQKSKEINLLFLQKTKEINPNFVKVVVSRTTITLSLFTPKSIPPPAMTSDDTL